MAVLLKVLADRSGTYRSNGDFSEEARVGFE